MAQEGLGGNLRQAIAPHEYGVLGKAAATLGPICTPVPFMWGCYVGQSLPPLAVPLTPTHLLGTRGASSLTNADTVSSRFGPSHSVLTAA